ncbi:hypothetical protein PN498_01330 [Oscillatoria sp. CS-180]|uniref:hypothetical protein n=1 Tax=Oscillatoria sp. CS-180 TaxID=3021720 RepID=UPI00232CAA72|nr:hypothetical protein [Oscillatoria sp. CS-180]MDB9524616.1 hypothetical protein [Oscillatoria sp. CS-180]
MSHTYEAFVDIKEYVGSQGAASSLIYTDRYEVDALSLEGADEAALSKATGIHPKASEFDVRITRLLK